MITRTAWQPSRMRLNEAERCTGRGEWHMRVGTVQYIETTYLSRYILLRGRVLWTRNRRSHSYCNFNILYTKSLARYCCLSSSTRCPRNASALGEALHCDVPTPTQLEPCAAWVPRIRSTDLPLSCPLQKDLSTTLDLHPHFSPSSSNFARQLDEFQVEAVLAPSRLDLVGQVSISVARLHVDIWAS
jgi:hypothetical protein